MSDRTLISNVVHAFDTFSSVDDIRRTIDTFHKSGSPTAQFELSQSLELMSSMYSSLQSFIRSTPDFQVLSRAEQSALFRRNMLGLLCIGSMYLMRESGIFDKPENASVIYPLYGIEMIEQAKSICRQLTCDPIVLKLMLIALAFSSNSYTFHDSGSGGDGCHTIHDSLLLGTFRLLGSQNVYVEIMWKYLLENYTYRDAVQGFSTLVKQLLETLRFSIQMYENNYVHQAFIDETIERAGNSPPVFENGVVPLWGKK